MQPAEVQQLIEAGLPGCQIDVTGDGSHFDIVVVGELFAGKGPVVRQQAIYATITDAITSGAIHAVNIKAYTPDEWETARKLRISQ